MLLLDDMQVLMFHSLAFVVGYYITRFSVSGSDRVPVARCISLETGMQVQLPSAFSICLQIEPSSYDAAKFPCCCCCCCGVPVCLAC